MATKLDKTVIRESTVIENERNVIVSLADDQTVKMKLKGMKSGEVSIGIQELYKQLTGGPVKDGDGDSVSTEKVGAITISHNGKKDAMNGPMINLDYFRSQYLISKDFPLDIKVKLEAITVKLLAELKK